MEETNINPEDVNVPTPAPETFEIPSQYVTDGKILGQYGSVNEMLDAVASGSVPAPAPAPQEAPEAAPEAAQETLSELAIPTAPEASEGLDTAEMASLWQEAKDNGGALTEESYKSLAGKGLGKDVVNMALAGIEAQRAQEAQQIAEAVGGEAKIHAAFEWAKGNLSEGEITEINAQLGSSTPTIQSAIIRDLIGRAGVGDGGRAVQGSMSSQAGPGPFESREQFNAAQRDPRYRQDPAFRAEVMTRLSKSSF